MCKAMKFSPQNNVFYLHIIYVGLISYLFSSRLLNLVLRNFYIFCCSTSGINIYFYKKAYVEL
jgi:hypothetical protein